MSTFNVSNVKMANNSNLWRAISSAFLFLLLSIPLMSWAQGKPIFPNLRDQVDVLQGQVEQQQDQLDSLDNLVQQQQDQINKLVDQNLPPVEIQLPAVFRGRYEDDGTANVGNNYFVGAFEFSGESREFRNFYGFDLSSILTQLEIPPDQFPQNVAVTIVSGELEVFNPQNGFISNHSDTEMYFLNRAGLFFGPGGINRTLELLEGSLGIAGFTDLADGPGYGSYVASAALNSNALVITLLSKAIQDMNFRLQQPTDGLMSPDPNSRFFAIGGSITTLNNNVDSEGLFSESTGANPITLFLKVKKTVRVE